MSRGGGMCSSSSCGNWFLSLLRRLFPFLFLLSFVVYSRSSLFKMHSLKIPDYFFYYYFCSLKRPEGTVFVVFLCDQKAENWKGSIATVEATERDSVCVRNQKRDIAFELRGELSERVLIDFPERLESIVTVFDSSSDIEWSHVTGIFELLESKLFDSLQSCSTDGFGTAPKKDW